MGVVKPDPRAEEAVIRVGRAGVAFVLILAVLDWVGWAAGIEVLTRLIAGWPQMTPWTALWLAALGSAILVRSYPNSPGRDRAGRGLAAAVFVTTVVILAEYVTGRDFGLDLWWFREAVLELQSSWPGRPSPRTALVALFLSATVVLHQRNRTSTRMVLGTLMLAALVIPGVAVLSYLFDALALVTIAETTGMAFTTAVCMLLLGAGALVLRPDGVPRSWLLSRPNRRALIRLGGSVASFPVLVGLSWRILLALGVGEREGLIISTTVGTVIVGATALYFTQRVTDLAERVQEQTDQLTTELDSAASYMASILPSGLDGSVTVSSCYLPSAELGGDCHDYRWIDDDHLVVYLIDVSGHGIAPSLLAASAHNMLRSGSFPVETAFVPEALLSELNTLFRMEQHNDHYFTMWYAVYEASTRTLRYASAGAPPALAFNGNGDNLVEAAELSTPAVPIGLFEETEFVGGCYTVPPGCRILVYSDGASELELLDGRQLTATGFKSVATRLAGSPDFSLDMFTEELLAMTAAGDFEDDCSAILLSFA